MELAHTGAYWDATAAIRADARYVHPHYSKGFAPRVEA